MELSDVFEKFIFTGFKNYNLDPCHYFSAPGLSWDAVLKMTKEELEKISNADMHLFIEKGMRGGISYLAKKYSKANNKYCPVYDKEKPEKYIVYLDINNLNGSARVNIYHMEDLNGLKLIMKQSTEYW